MFPWLPSICVILPPTLSVDFLINELILLEMWADDSGYLIGIFSPSFIVVDDSRGVVSALEVGVADSEGVAEGVNEGGVSEGVCGPFSRLTILECSP